MISQVGQHDGTVVCQLAYSEHAISPNAKRTILVLFDLHGYINCALQAILAHKFAMLFGLRSHDRQPNTNN